MRTAILDEALSMMRDGGVEGISLRELARRLDYSPAALYRYFENRDQIISTLTAESMALLAEQLRAAARGGEREPLISLGEAYLAFARQEPVRFRFLFTDLVSTRRSLREPPRDNSPYLVLLEAVRAAIADGRVSQQVDPESAAYTLWSLVHGMAVLESTHLSGFQANFARLHRQALQRLIESWMPVKRRRVQR